MPSMARKRDDLLPLPVLSHFVLLRSDKPVFCSSNFDYVIQALAKRIRGLGYAEEIVDQIRFKIKDREAMNRVVQAVHPYLKHDFSIIEVEGV